MKFVEVLEKLRKESTSTADMGEKFERLMLRYLKSDPTYAKLLESVMLWKDFPYKDQLGGMDTGIDIVGKTPLGEWWAIQCKFYAEGNPVTKKDMDTFLATSGRTFIDSDGETKPFSFRLIIATTDNWSSNALDVMKGQTIKVGKVTLGDLEEVPVDWSKIFDGGEGLSVRKPKHTPMEHQKEAISKAMNHFASEDRGQMIMACGTGKTFTSLKIAEELVRKRERDVGGSAPEMRCVLFLAPSISLVGQTLREWVANSDFDINPIGVCSDPKVTRRIREDDLGETVEDLGMPATTDPGKILQYHENGKGLTVIFSTYQSIDQVIEAQAIGFPDFDLIVCDEAHRTVGSKKQGDKDKHFTKVHDNESIKAAKRLYMTATSRIYGVKGKEDAKKESVVLYSMDDEDVYGKTFYTINFGNAVQKDLLSDYKVLILTVTESHIPPMIRKMWEKDKEIDVDLDCKIWGVLNALEKKIVNDDTVRNTDPGLMRSALMFTNTIFKSKILTNRFNELSEIYTGEIKAEARHVDGSMDAMQRDKDLRWLASADEGRCNVLSNVRCLGEGVDVPALDAIIFLSSKNSLVDIVQSVGRVMRKAEGKKYGYVIIPVVVPEDKDPEKTLEDNERFKTIWQVLRALRSHDEEIENEINSLLYRDKPGGRIHIGSPGLDIPKELIPTLYTLEIIQGQYTLDDFQDLLMARLVLKVGDKEYIENWAKDVAKVMPPLVDRLNEICLGEIRGYKGAFKRYLKGLRGCVNDNVSEEDAINMLAQQIVTKPIFEELFGSGDFATRNPVSVAIDGMLEEIHAKEGLKEIEAELDKFYDKVKKTLSRIDTTEGKQKVIAALYEKFFKNAFPKDQAINGVVYTPIKIVDFILRSAADVLKDEFGLDINDEDVNILDPFTGTGTFIARLIETGIIDKENLERKYRNELFANEITLLAYYIAAVNIENTFSRIMESEEYVPFDNIILTDTFNIEQICNQKTVQTDLTGEEVFKENKERIRKQHDTHITVIMGNPPYGANQKSANDDARKRSYEDGVDSAIQEKYLDDKLFDDMKGNVNSVYDNYVRAFRWSTDRIGNNDGAILFVTPNGWLTGSAFVGFRKCIEKEFSKIFVFDLRGDQNGQNWREEGEKVFGQGSKVGISITLLIKRKDFKGKAKVHYVSTRDYMKRQEKFDLLTTSHSFSKMQKKGSLKVLDVKDNGDWIIERNELFQELIPLAGDTYKKFEKHNENTIFVGYSRGYGTSRDTWMYNFSKELLSKNMHLMLDEYRKQTSQGIIEYKTDSISWNSSLIQDSKQNVLHEYDAKHIRVASTRPFVKQYLYEDRSLIYETAQMPSIFPTPETKNLLICVAGVGDKNDFTCLITNCMTDLHIVGTSQCFPLYWYEDPGELRLKNKQMALFDDAPSVIRHDGISDYILNVAKSKYGPQVTKEDIFYYVYGYLHSPKYREAFSADLKMSLPKIGFVDDMDAFCRFSSAGRELADLHINYENREPPSTLKYKCSVDIEELFGNRHLSRVTKMKLDEEKRKLVYNEHLVIENIPAEAFEYVVNGRSALGWLVDRYQYRVDKKSGIVNDPNDYGGGEYVLKLILSVITVSVETMRIVRSLPELEFPEPA